MFCRHTLSLSVCVFIYLLFFPPSSGACVQSCCYCFAERSDDEMCLFSHMEVTHVIKQTNKPSSAAPDPSSFPSVLRQNDNDIKLVSSILGADDRDTSPPIWYRNSDANEDNTSHIRIREDELPGVIISSCGHAAHRLVCLSVCLCIIVYVSKLRCLAPLLFICYLT